jgi:uncharacterized protein (TIGR03118 family)
VTIAPAPSSPPGTLGTPAGTVGNIGPNATDFTVTERQVRPRSLHFRDGTISGWNPGVDGIDPNTGASHATLATDGSNVGAVYTGLAIAANKAGQTFLYAADDGPNRRIDIFDGTFSLVKSFGDPAIPRGFSPYGIQTINGHIWVTYTALNKAQGGFVDIFDTEGDLVKHFASNGPLHSPWGIALAPADFGPMSNAILISNNTSRSRVNAFNPKTGQFLGPLRDANGKAIFTGGPNNYANGIFGMITFEH